MSNVGKICDNLSDDVLPKSIQTVTLNLLQDEEVYVRAVAAAHIAEIAKKMAPETIIADVLPVGGKLSTDANSHVRTSFAGAVTRLARQIGKTTSRKYLFDTVERCLKDSETEV